MDLQTYRTLGRSGLAVSPLALGTMTFGTARWGLDENGSRAVFDAYRDRGGNFIDTADVYAGGESEAMIGRFVAQHGARDRLVVATKSGFATGSGPHAGGNGAKHVHQALDRSLRRLKTDYVDLYWVHVWDGITPAEELLETMAGIVRAGKARYWGLSNTPAWYAAKLATLASVRGLPGPIGLQYFYSLVNRDVEDEHVPLAAEFGLGMVPWSPLAYGLLTGKYDRGTVEAAPPRAGGLPKDAASAHEVRPADDKRLDGPNPFGDSLFTPRNWDIVGAVRRVANEAGHSPAQVALAWVVGRAAVASTLMGVSRSAQVEDNIAALDLVLSTEQLAVLDAATAPAEPRLVYSLSRQPVRDQVIFGGHTVLGQAIR
jgi:aryl-alcohol dehydrogenase-like predicted oxidoreductase